MTITAGAVAVGPSRHHQLAAHFAGISLIVVFLLGAMTIELIDAHATHLDSDRQRRRDHAEDRLASSVIDDVSFVARREST